MSAPAMLAVPPIGIPAASASVADGYLFGKGRTFQTFSLLCLLMVFDFADRMILAALIPAIKAEWLISDATSGLLGSLLTLGMVLFAFPASFVIDRWSRIKTASLMGVLWSIASAVGALAQSVGQLAVSRAFVGIGEAGYAPAAYAWIAAAFPRRRLQLALGTFSAAQPIGMAFGVALGGYVAAHYGWRHALGIVALPGLFIALWLYRGRDYKNLPQRSAEVEVDGSIIPTRAAAVLRKPSLLLAYLGAAMGTLQWVPLVFFLPSFLNRAHAIPVQTASLLTSGILLLSIVGVPLGGWAMDRWSLRHDRAKLIWPAIAGSLATLLYGAAFGLVEDFSLQYGLIMAAVFVGSTAGTGPLAMTQELVHPAIRAFSGTCSVVTIHLLGSVPGPFLAGLLSDHFGLRHALLVLPLASGLLQLIALLFALRYYRRDLARVGCYTLESA